MPQAPHTAPCLPGAGRGAPNWSSGPHGPGGRLDPRGPLSLSLGTVRGSAAPLPRAQGGPTRERLHAPQISQVLGFQRAGAPSSAGDSLPLREGWA